METKLNQWFLKQKQRNATMSEDLLVAKAQTFFYEVYGSKRGCFSASRGWISRFRRRYGIRNLCEEKRSKNLEKSDNRNLEIEEFQLALQNLPDAQLTQEEMKEEEMKEENMEEENMEEQINVLSSEEKDDHNSDQKEFKKTHVEGIAALTTALEWAIENEFPSADVLCLFRIREKAINLQHSKLKQSLIPDVST